MAVPYVGAVRRARRWLGGGGRVHATMMEQVGGSRGGCVQGIPLAGA